MFGKKFPMRIEIFLIGISLILPLASEKPFKNVNIQVSEIRFQLGDIGQRTKEELLEWELSNGNVSSMELMEKVLSGRSLDANLFDEYVQMDISNGIEELNELLDEWKTAQELNVKEEDRKKILDALDGFKVPNSSELLKELEEQTNNFIQQTAYAASVLHSFDTIPNNLFAALEMIEKLLEKYPKENYVTQDQKDTLDDYDYERMSDVAREVSYQFEEINDFFHELLEAFNSTVYANFDPSERLEEASRFIEGIEDQTKKFDMSVLKELENEMTPIEVLRDKTMEKVKNLTEKLEDTVSKMGGIGIQKKTLEDNKNVESTSEFLQKVTKFSKSVNRVVRQFQTMKRRWLPTMNHLDQLQIPPGYLSVYLGRLQDCLSFSVDYHQMRVNDSLLEQLKEIHQLYPRIDEFVDKLKEHNYPELLEKFKNAADPKNTDTELRLQTFYDFDPTIFDNIRGDLEPTEKDGKMTKMGSLVRRYGDLAENILSNLVETKKYLRKDLREAEKHLKCLSKSVPQAKPLIDLPPKAWNFDPKPTRHLVETVLGFKRIHRMMIELNEWKFEKKMESFGLDEQDVNAIQEGIEVVEQLGDIDGLLEKMNELSGINTSEVEDSWNTVKTALIQLNSELSDHLPPIDTNLTHLRSAISAIQLPSDLPIQLIIDWVNGNLKGVVRSEYENTLQRLIHLDFENYSKKLDEMSNAIEKWSGNKGSAEEEEEEDCLVNNTCTTPQSEL